MGDAGQLVNRRDEFRLAVIMARIDGGVGESTFVTSLATRERLCRTLRIYQHNESAMDAPRYLPLFRDKLVSSTEYHLDHDIRSGCHRSYSRSAQCLRGGG